MSHDRQNRIDEAINFALLGGWFEKVDHKQWAFDQILRSLLGEEYDQVIADEGVDGDKPYEWDAGAAP